MITGGGNDGRLKIHNIARDEPSVTLPKIHTRSINAIDIAPDDETFVSASGDGIELFDFTKNASNCHLVNKPPNDSTSYLPLQHQILDCKYLAPELLISCGIDHQLNFFDLRQSGRSPHFAIDVGDDNLNSMDHAHNTISLGSSNGSLYLVDIRNQKLICHKKHLPIIYVSNHGDSSLINYANGDVTLTSDKNRNVDPTVNIGQTVHYKINSTLRDNVIISGTETGVVQFWKFNPHTHSVAQKPALTISTDSSEGKVLNVYTTKSNHLIATAGDGRVHIWDTLQEYIT
jgi:WD40 repeat protein